jgi:D-alanyl-D-alanine carboxypeptidase
MAGALWRPGEAVDSGGTRIHALGRRADGRGEPRRKRHWRRFAHAVFAAATAAALLGGPARGEDAEKGAVLIVDANSGRVLQQSAADAPRHPASLAKLMTLYLLFERMKQGKLGYQTKIRVSAEAAAAAPSKLELDAGAEIALIDAIKLLITKSANDVAVAIAEHIAGSETKFARLMTQKARRLGMAATTFRNASGLPDDEQVTTARDMVTLALHLADDFPEQYPLFATRTFSYNGETFVNHNSLLTYFPGTDGLKTGYTRASGFNLVASMHRGRKHLVGVIFGGASAASRDRAMQGYLLRAVPLAADARTRVPVPVRVAASVPRPAAAAPPPQRALRPPAPAPAARPASRPAETQAESAAERRTAHGEAPSRERAAATAIPPAAPASEARLATPAIALPRVRQVLLGEHSAGAAGPAEGEPSGIGALLARGDGAQAEERAVSLALNSAPDGAAARSAADHLGAVAPVAAPAPAGDEPRLGSAPPQAAHGFLIQIGAYQSAAEAQRQLALARSRAPQLLQARAPVTEEVRQGTRLLFRARYGGFAGADGAAHVCQTLKRVGFDCLVIKGQ